MSKNKRLPVDATQMKAFVHICAEKVSHEWTKYDFNHKIGDEILSYLKTSGKFKELKSKDINSKNLGRRLKEWLKKSEDAIKARKNKVIYETHKIEPHLKFLDVDDWNMFVEKYELQIREYQIPIEEISSREATNKKPVNNQEIKKRLNYNKSKKYYLKARLLPAISCLLPLIISLVILFLDVFTLNRALFIIALTTILFIILINVFTSAFVNNSKKYENEIFDNRHGFPTNELIYNKCRDNDFMFNFDRKVKKDFNLRIPIDEGGLEVSEAAKNKLENIVASIRHRMRYNEMVQSHNINYGMLRNLIGGSVFAISSSILGTVIGLVIVSAPLITFGILSIIIFIVLLRNREKLLRNAALAYARQLIEEYQNT